MSGEAVRQVIVIANVSKDLKNGDVDFEPTYRHKEDPSAKEPYWEYLEELNYQVNKIYNHADLTY